MDKDKISELKLDRDNLMKHWERLEEGYKRTLEALDKVYQWKVRNIVDGLVKIDAELDSLNKDDSQVTKK